MAVEEERQNIQKLTKFRIIKNLVLISLSFFLLFTAYDGLSMLQSTMNTQGGIGVLSQGVGFLSFGISSLLLPKYFIKKLGCKSTLFISLLFYLPVIIANFYPKWYTLIPAGVLAGIGASLLWGSQGTYFNESAVRYTSLITGGSVSTGVPSYGTNVKAICDPKLRQDIREEIPPRDEVSAKCKLEDIMLEIQCQKPGCGNVDQFVVSEISVKCVQYLENTVADSDLTQTKEQITSQYSNVNGNSQCKDILPLPGNQQNFAYEKPCTREGINKELKVEEQDDNGRLNKRSVSKFDEEPESSKVNQDYQPIFQKVNTLESVTGLFFGCHGIAYFLARICSNVISYSVLKGDDKPAMSSLFESNCGADFCNANNLNMDDNTEYVTKYLRYLLTTISAVMASMSALLIFLFLDPLKKEKSEDEPENVSLSLVLATIKHNMKKEQLCLIPISFFEGMLEGFYAADFTKAYIGCAWGTSKISLVSMFYGAASVISSSASGLFVKNTGRKPLFLLGQVIIISLMIFLILWKPESTSPYKFYTVAIFFGTFTGILWSVLPALYGLLFKKDEEAAFASYYLWMSMGETTSFLLSNHLCTNIKIYLMLTMSIFGTIGYIFSERSYQLRKKQCEAAST